MMFTLLSLYRTKRVSVIIYHRRFYLTLKFPSCLSIQERQDLTEHLLSCYLLLSTQFNQYTTHIFLSEGYYREGYN